MITARIHVAYFRKLTDWPRGKVLVDISSIRATEVDCICLARNERLHDINCGTGLV